MQIQHTPAPFPSTILSLAESEQFYYRRTRIQTITLSPDAPHQAVLSGPSALPPFRLQTHTVPSLSTAIPKGLQPALRAAGPAPQAHLQAVPSLPATPHTPRKGAHRAR